MKIGKWFPLISSIVTLGAIVLILSVEPKIKFTRDIESQTSFWIASYKTMEICKKPIVKMFTKTEERSLMVFSDFSAYLFTTHTPASIDLSGVILTKVLEKRSRCWKEVILLIHNHPTSNVPSEGDLVFVGWARAKGFSGRAFLYYMPDKEFIEVK
jgi:hypothetical protein